MRWRMAHMKLPDIDFDTPEYHISQRHAQHEFLREIKTNAPEVLVDLSAEPFRLYREARGSSARELIQ